jgi:hypothetical protein
VVDWWKEVKHNLFLVVVPIAVPDRLSKKRRNESMPTLYYMHTWNNCTGIFMLLETDVKHGCR